MIGATLFSGIGAPETAMPSWRWPWHAEIENFPSAVLAQRHPDSKNLGNVTAHDFCERAAAVAWPDIIVFGSPCQSFSVAGKRLGMDDPRGNLALVALGIIARLKPRWFVFENVPGLLSSAKGSDFGIFLRTVDELRYSLAWTMLDAQHFGVAQRRERVFAVGHLGDWRGPAAVLFEPEGLCGHHPPRRQAGERVADSFTVGANQCSGAKTDFVEAFNNTGHGWWNQESVAAGMRDASAGGASHATIVARYLNAHAGRIDYESETFVTHALRADGFDASEDGTGRGTPLVPICFQSNASGDNISFGDNISHTLKAGADGGWHNAPAIAFPLQYGNAQGGKSQGGVGAGNANDPSYTLDQGPTHGVAFGSAVRRLTPRECERLQSFPDDYTLITYRNKPAADGPRYKGLGNSMNVKVMRWILSRIEHVESLGIAA